MITLACYHENVNLLSCYHDILITCYHDMIFFFLKPSHAVTNVTKQTRGHCILKVYLTKDLFYMDLIT
jgi:hypothetical protein